MIIIEKNYIDNNKTVYMYCTAYYTVQGAHIMQHQVHMAITRKVILGKHNWMAPGKRHITAISTEIFEYVRIHPNFASRPVLCEKMFLCCFSLKAGRKDLTDRPKVLSPHPPHCFLPCSTGFLISRVSKFSIFQEERSNWGVCVGGGVGCRGGGVKENFRPVCQVFSFCF